jgi:hypothetical protein
MPWQRVEEISEYRLNTKKLDVWLKKKWGDFDYEIEVGITSLAFLLVFFSRALYQYNNGLYSFWSLEPKTEVSMALSWAQTIRVADGG